MKHDPSKISPRGPFRADQIRAGDPYELSKGHPLLCVPTGGRGSRANLLGGAALESDPAVTEAGVDTGFSPDAGTMRAPDVAVGNVPDEPGWVKGAPPLAVEYADRGQDEDELQAKIAELIAAGTRYVWVVRLSGPRRVEVYEPEMKVRTVLPGEALVAPGVLKNAVPVEALYDREAAHEVTLRNLLQRRGFESLEAVHAEGQLAQARASLRRLLAGRGLALSAEEEARIEATADLPTLERWFDRALVATSAADALG